MVIDPRMRVRDMVACTSVLFGEPHGVVVLGRLGPHVTPSTTKPTVPLFAGRQRQERSHQLTVKRPNRARSNDDTATYGSPHHLHPRSDSAIVLGVPAERHDRAAVVDRQLGSQGRLRRELSDGLY